MIGNKDWPFPIPVVKKGEGWVFDTAKGREEILNRRIGQNELDAAQVSLAYVDAQREYAKKDRDGDGLVEYAQRFRSDPGKKNGLYWQAKAGEESSPLGPLCRARREGEGTGKTNPTSPRPTTAIIIEFLQARARTRRAAPIAI